ncbi:chaperonin, mitochondrial [Glycine max]|nr:chaperonin, mitochondrial [Glycine max]
MAKRLIPCFNRILIEKIVPPSKTSAGILLPEKTSQLNSGKVIAVGPGSRDKAGNLIPVSVKEGDHVLLPEYGGTQIKLDDKEYGFEIVFHLFRDEDILGILHD